MSSVISTSSLIISSGLLSTFNSNTLGNLFTTGGNVGINTTSPTTLDINGNIRINTSNSTTSNRITTNATDNFIYSSNTVGHYSLMWAIDQATGAGPMSYLYEILSCFSSLICFLDFCIPANPNGNR